MYRCECHFAALRGAGTVNPRHYSDRAAPLTKAHRQTLSAAIDGLSSESEQGMRCGTQVPNPQLPPQL
ncbi:hypothetical protein SBBP2_1750001 [Burkholderiales bacterium]|nr:hypothetical protein SBBP2_1750001 [Burkholderiales bacterium]